MTSGNARAKTVSPTPHFEISFPKSVHQEPITGRVLLMISRTNEPEVRFQVGWTNSPPAFGLDVQALIPGEAAVINHEVSMPHAIPNYLFVSRRLFRR